ncbi:MAG: alanine--tRNA ligase [Bacilli bacterium]|nr:alanine--tRNA ligase [Bacilli bacterium]
MKNLTSNEIRKLWLSFFKAKNHAVIEGASLVPVNDKTLLWINSGVAALKQYFDGSKVSNDRRLVNVQKSIRTNDIENVGKTNRHHTFFEMLGNFSLGDYFRKEAIVWGFEFLTSKEYLGLPLDKLYFTYHPSDLETKALWISCGVDPKHVIPNSGNFWEIGEGPCGPNTEIFFDLGEELDPLKMGAKLLEDDVDNDRFLEIWNIVFSQYNAKAGVKREDYKELPSKNIDTGAGLERIASVLQNAPSNFETDLFMPIIKEIEDITGTKYADHKVAYRVIADHIRTTTFALSDGATFANEGRGYVLRRVLRRAVRYGKKLGITEPILYKLVPVVIKIMEPFYPYLNNKAANVAKQIKAEEERFLNTLTHGEELLRNALNDSKVVSGELAFKLYDTFGFPLEITKEVASEVGAKVDEIGFETLLEGQREKARAARKNQGSMNIQSEDLLKFNTPSKFQEDTYKLEAKVIGLFKDGVKVNEGKDEVSAVFDVTPFYSESGGQVSDSGTIYSDDFRATVTLMSKAPHGQHLHQLDIEYGTIKVGDTLTLEIDKANRRAITLNHSATHFLHRALNDVLGPEVGQAGSYVGPDYLRFDFNYNTRITKEELNRIENIVNKYVHDAIPLTIKFMSLEAAKKLGAKALFMEKYGDLVRVVMYENVSIELCGGTHVKNSSEIGAFVITSEGSVASGIRRIVALSGLKAYEYLKEYQYTVNHLGEVFGIKEIKDVIPTAKNVMLKKDELSAEVNKYKLNELEDFAKNLKPINEKDLNLYVYVGEGKTRDELGLIADKIKSQDQRAVIVLLSDNALLISLSKGLTSVLNANKIMKLITAKFGGSGGGRPDFANGSIKEKARLQDIISLVKQGVNE